MVKIIKEGKKENYKFKAFCKVCGCEFEYELVDLKKEYDYYMVLTSYSVQYRYVRYVECRCCHVRVIHDQGSDVREYPNVIYTTTNPSNTQNYLDCETCPNRPDPNNPVFGDTPCTFCKKMRPVCE